MDLKRLINRFLLIGPNSYAQTQGGLYVTKAYRDKEVNLVWGASIAIDASLANVFKVVMTSGAAAVFAAPTLPPATGTTAGFSQTLLLQIQNQSGGAGGAVTFDPVFKLGAAWANPADGFGRWIEFQRDFGNGFWYETFRSAADIAN